MESIVRFSSKRLRLKVNPTKSAVARPEERHFLGFRLRRGPLEGSVEVVLSKRSRDRVYKKVQRVEPKRRGRKVSRGIRALNAELNGGDGRLSPHSGGWG